MSHYFYITPEEYKQAEVNGVSAKRLEQRIRQCGWSKERAMNEPVRQKNNLTKWVEVAKSNGIKYQTFKSRIYNGMDVETAATQPTKTKKEVKACMLKGWQKYPDELRRLAKANGIAYATFYHRIRKGMDPQLAATKPLMTKQEVGKITAKLYEDYRAGRR